MEENKILPPNSAKPLSPVFRFVKPRFSSVSPEVDWRNKRVSMNYLVSVMTSIHLSSIQQLWSAIPTTWGKEMIKGRRAEVGAGNQAHGRSCLIPDKAQSSHSTPRLQLEIQALLKQRHNHTWSTTRFLSTLRWRSHLKINSSGLSLLCLQVLCITQLVGTQVITMRKKKWDICIYCQYSG